MGDVVMGRNMAKDMPHIWKPRHFLGDTAYDDQTLLAMLTKRNIEPVIPNHPRRKKPYPFDQTV